MWWGGRLLEEPLRSVTKTTVAARKRQLYPPPDQTTAVPQHPMYIKPSHSGVEVAKARQVEVSRDIGTLFRMAQEGSWTLWHVKSRPFFAPEDSTCVERRAYLASTDLPPSLKDPLPILMLLREPRMGLRIDHLLELR